MLFRSKIGNYEIKIHPIFMSATIFVVFFIIGISPLLFHLIAPGYDIGLTDDGIKYTDSYKIQGAKFTLIGYVEDSKHKGEFVGPFGLGASILSLFLPLSIGLAIGTYYRNRSKNVIKIREASKKLEKEFAGALFQLGNRIGDGIPAEIAFSKVADVMAGTTSGNFFELVSTNINKLGMSVEEAIFDPKQGAINSYPSNLIESSMKVLIESSKKGPDRKSTRLNSSHVSESRMPSSA